MPLCVTPWGSRGELGVVTSGLPDEAAQRRDISYIFFFSLYDGRLLRRARAEHLDVLYKK